MKVSFLRIWGHQARSLRVHLIWWGAPGPFRALELDADHRAPQRSSPVGAVRSWQGTVGCAVSFSTTKLLPVGVHPRSGGSFLGRDLVICICVYLFTTSSPLGGFYGKATKYGWRNKHRSHSCPAEPVCFKPCFISSSWSCQPAARHRQ